MVAVLAAQEAQVASAVLEEGELGAFEYSLGPVDQEFQVEVVEAAKGLNQMKEVVPANPL